MDRGLLCKCPFDPWSVSRQDLYAVFIQTKLGRPRSRINFFAVEPGNVTFQQVVECQGNRNRVSEGLQTATPISPCGWCSINSPSNLDAANKVGDYRWNESRTNFRKKSVTGPRLGWIDLLNFYCLQISLQTQRIFCVGRRNIVKASHNSANVLMHIFHN